MCCQLLVHVFENIPVYSHVIFFFFFFCNSLAKILSVLFFFFFLKLTKGKKITAPGDNKPDDKGETPKDKDLKEIKPEVKDTKIETIQPLSEGPTKAKNIKRKAKLIKTPIIGILTYFIHGRNILKEEWGEK